MAGTAENTPLDLERVFEQINAEINDPNRIPEPDWYTPNDFACNEARRFRDPANGGLGERDIDEAVVRRLLKIRYDRTRREIRNFAPYRDWYAAPRRLICDPERTCPGMTEAGRLIADTIDRGERIAVYCDYDVDGTSGGAAFHLALKPYQPQLMFGFADAQQGFGLTDAFVDEAVRAGAKVLITLDCGTGQPQQVTRAQQHGLKVIVVDHHDTADNPADFHLNPKLSEPPSSQNTGAQLAFKLAAAVQIAKEGRTRPSLWEQPLKLAGIGALADMGSVLLHENRAFFWAAADHPTPGYAALAEAVGEDPTWPGQNVITQAILNLPKRTVHVDAGDVFNVLTAPSAEDARPLIAKLLASYEQAKPVRERMQQEALTQTGEMTTDENGRRCRPNPDDLVAFAVLDGYSDYAGYSGVVAGRVADRAGKPTFVIVTRQERDSQERQIAKLSGRPAYGCPTLEELADDPEIIELCTVERLDESGQLTAKQTFGGHAREGVFAGSIYVDSIPAFIEAVQRVAREVRDRLGGVFFPPPYTGPEASVSERQVPAARLERCEADARRLGPFSSRRELVLDPAGAYDSAGADTGGERYETHTAMKVSVCGRLTGLEPDPDTDGRWLRGTLDLGDGITREIRYPADAEERPEGVLCEWVLRLGGPQPYWLRTFHRLERARP